MKETFKEIFKNHIKREGAESLLEWLENRSDFFKAPASTKYHLSKEGGLCEHSINVFSRLGKITETGAICGLLHDICKANFYKIEMRNAKDENGQWVKVPYYTVEEKFPFGHGEKSVFLIERFTRLKEDEAVAIRYHMGGFDTKPNDYGVNLAFSKYPLALELHIADLQATFIDEVAAEEKK